LDESISPVPKMVALLDNDNLGELERFKDFVKKSSGIKILVILNHPKRGDAKICQDLGSCAFLAFPFKGEDLSRMLVALNHWKVGDELITQYGLSPLVEQAQAAKSRRKLKILIVEDNIINQRVASIMLKRMNHVTDLAANGLEALAMLDQFDYDLILMDCHMPEMDGYEATLNIRGRLDDKANVAIVAMTANAMEADVKRCYDVGMDEFISKPVKRELLDHTLQHIKLKRNLILV
jgi:CheY-like chemotaxis protein